MKTSKITFDAPSGRTVTIEGVRSTGGTRYIHVRYGGKSGYVRRDKFVDEKAEARSELRRQQVLVVKDKDWSAIIEEIDGIDKFKKFPLIERPGRSDPYFAMKDGTILAPPGSPKGQVIFERAPSSTLVMGTLAEWQELIAKHLAGQDLLIVAVLAAMASPLVAFTNETVNFGIDLSGPPERGKTTWLMLMASVARDPSQIPSFNSTKAGLETLFDEFNDMPFPIDEANLADSGDKHFVQQVIFRMANGTLKLTAYRQDLGKYRFVFATSANRPLRDALNDTDQHSMNAAMQRLLPLRIGENDSLGIFSSVPVGFGSTGEFATYLTDTMLLQYGTPMRAFLQALVEVRAKNPEAFVTRLRQRIDDFASAAGVAATNRAKTRATSSFGLFYAAGCFAKAKKILPENWDCMAACLTAYRNYQSCLPNQTPLEARLLTIAQLPETLDLRDGTIPQLPNSKLAQHGAFIKLGKRGRVELLLTERVQREFFDDWRQLKQTDRFKALNLSAKDHDGQQRQVRQGKKKERFICFILPPELVEQLPQALLPTR